eukprot:scaffold94762_cov62-Phaeocystis_antarctica.AAC.1
MAASLPGAIDGARAHARRSARDIATITVASALLSASSLSGLMTNGGKPSPFRTPQSTKSAFNTLSPKCWSICPVVIDPRLQAGDHRIAPGRRLACAYAELSEICTLRDAIR